MKKISLIVSLMTLAFVSFGQKVDLDKFNFTFEYRDLPLVPQNPEYNTFSVKTNTTSAVRDNYSESGLEERVNIQGWKRVSGVSGHLIVSVSLDDLIISSSNVIERIDIQKDKDGKETGRKYYYKVEAVYSWQGSTAVRDFKGADIGKTSLGSSSTSTWTSSEYSTRKEAADYFSNNRTEIKGSLIRNEVNAALTSLTDWLGNNYGYTVRKDSESLWILDSKKHPETAAQKENWEKFKAAVATVKADNISDETIDQFKSVIAYFDGISTRFATEDKNDKKMRYASYYNKAKIYMYLDLPELAIKEAESLIANVYDDGDGKRLKKEAEALVKLFEKNNKISRHFSIDLSAAAAPAGN